VRNETIHDLLKKASRRLAESGVDTPRLNAEVLLAHATESSRSTLIAHPEVVPTEEQTALFREWIELRAKRMPLAYIYGSRGFYGLEFEVTPAVLIPRPETETLVETTIRLLGDKPCKIADLGVGSGAIAVSLAVWLPEAHLYCTDTSHEALEIARRNAEKNGVGDRIHLREGNLLEPLDDLSFDAIVSNPPYILSREIDLLQPEIALYEPRAALNGGPDGLDYFRRIVPESPGYLKLDGFLLVEVGMRQSGEVCALFQENGYLDVQVMNDYAGIERVIVGHV
jgi:release factor glutamine methyltransferase